MPAIIFLLNATSPYPTPRLSTSDKAKVDYIVFLVCLILGAILAFLYQILVALPATVPSLRRKFLRPNVAGSGPLE
jgi:hypothetical protein